MNGSFSAASLLAIALLLSASPSRAADVSGHRPGLRDQWQPQMEHDARLAQTVRIEILGRAVAPALEMLSKGTGVTLRVAPENLDTVGERKLTIIAQGCDLKSVLVQTAKALQECHWDVDLQGKEPAYLLHRDAGADVTIAELAQWDTARKRAVRRPAREERLAEARRALAMSPQELAELEKTDPLLARTVQDPEARERMQTFLSLPEERIEEFLSMGETTMNCAEAPARLRESVRTYTQAQVAELAASEKGLGQDSADFLRTASESLDEWALTYREPHDDADEIYPERARQIWLRIAIHGKTGGEMWLGWVALPPLLPSADEAPFFRDLLLRTGTPTGEAADALLSDLTRRHDAVLAELQQRRRAAKEEEPADPRLRRSIALSRSTPPDSMEVARVVARGTGLSVISDYFTMPIAGLPDEVYQAMPAWRLLNLLGEDGKLFFDWEAAGDCLTMQNRLWANLVARELPESVVVAYRAKLTEQGTLTLDDALAAMQTLGGRSISEMSIPRDLEEAGLSDYALSSEPVLLYAMLSAEQRDKARGRTGLSYREMTPAQQELVRRRAAQARRPLSQEEVLRTAFRLLDITIDSDSGSRPGTGLAFAFPDFPDLTPIPLRLPGAPPAGPTK